MGTDARPPLELSPMKIVRGMKHAVLDHVCTDVRSLIENINPVYLDGFSHKDEYHKDGIVHYIF